MKIVLQVNDLTINIFNVFSSLLSNLTINE